MTGRIVWNREGNARYYLDKQEVTKEEFDVIFPPRSMADDVGNCPLSAVPVMRSEALSVHPKQIQAAIDDAKRKGVPTEFDQHGRPVFTSRDHQRRYAREYGFVNKDDNWSGKEHGGRQQTSEELAREYVDL